jgi:diguanylate cyclase (GGDEF)-like protein
VPLVAQGETVGLLHVNSGASDEAASPTPLGEATQRRATTVAEHVGLAIANLLLRETLRNQSIRDPLTGLFNRRFLEETLERELLRAARSQRPLGVIVLDLDHFKRFNDTYGHQAGDALLRELGGLLRDQLRGGDVPCRYGGEEFVLILPEASLDSTRRRAGQLREAVHRLQVADRGQSLGLVTLSAGVAVFPTHGTSGDALIRAADAALYRAKAAGRDQVQVAAPSVEG